MLVYLSLGANLGNREETINKALDLLSEQVGPLIKRSSFYYSEPWGFDSQNDFCNICASFNTILSPLELLATTQSIERQLGRKKKITKLPNSPINEKMVNEQMRKYEDRLIDIDIIRAFENNGSEIFFTHSTLHIPHVYWKQRDFVKVPLSEIMH